MNAMEWNRDLRSPVSQIRRREQHLTDRPDRGNNTVAFPEMRRGGIGLCVATQIARHVQTGNPLPGWHSPEQAWAQTQGQLAWYRAMEEADELVPIIDAQSLDAHLKRWSGFVDPQAARNRSRSAPAAALPIGCILSLEGADSILSMAHLERSFQQGLRALGPAHYGPGVFAQGTNSTGGLGRRGRELLKEMDRLGIILDVTHLTDEGFWEALDCFQGPVWASHCNCRRLAPHQRQLSDDQIKALIEREAVIGAAFDAWMMVPNWIKGRTTPQSADLKLERIVQHIEHVCQIAGNARHCGIGSDLDGGFGREQAPSDLDTISDLQKVGALLKNKGFSQQEVAGILHGNFIRFLRKAWQ
jgi:membrane dipeptidase